MAATLIFAAICVAGIAFMLRFLAAIYGVAGRAACVGYAVRTRQESDGGKGSGKHKDEGVRKAPTVPLPSEERLPEHIDIPVWQQRPVNGLRGNASKPRQQY